MRKGQKMTTVKLRIGEVSKLTGLHFLTIKSLEKRGLIKAERSLAGHRLFDFQVVEKIKKIYHEQQCNG
jgi:DNA-binding transcriptional MerR regulator